MILLNDNYDNIDNNLPTTATAVCGVKDYLLCYRPKVEKLF